jgi:VanZ family protein
MGRIWWGVLAVMWMAGIWYLSDQPYLSTGLEHDFLWRKLAHVFVYAVLTWLLARSMNDDWRQPKNLALAAAGALLYAVIDEWHQSWVPGREGSAVDVLIDAAGIAIVLAAGLVRR